MHRASASAFSYNSQKPLLSPRHSGGIGWQPPRDFDRDHGSRTLAMLGLGLSIIAGVSCLVGGFYANTHATKNPAPSPPTYNIGWSIEDHSIEREILALWINILVAICTEAIGFVHSVSLRSTLGTEGRLEFTTNLRLLTAARGNFGNGTTMNGIMAVLLVASYAASSMILPRYTYENNNGQLQHVSNTSDQPDLAIWPIPLIALGAVLLLQAVIAIAGVLTSPTGIQTWSASQFDLTAAAILDAHTPVTYHPGRCMMSVRERHAEPKAFTPSYGQPSPWTSHPRVQKVVWFTWMFTPAYIIGGAAIVQLTNPTLYKNLSWSFLPNGATFTHTFNLGTSIIGVIFTFIVVIVAQSPLTMGLHGCEIITNIVRDEKAWRRASGASGAPMSNGVYTTMKDLKKNPGAGFAAWWPTICLLAVKPVFHWTFGLAFHSSGVIMEVGPVQFFYLAVMMGIFTAIMSLLAFHSPTGPQPAAYGHLQTLADLIDFWPPRKGRIYWGDKPTPMPHTGVYHAGTSNEVLPPVKTGFPYAGEDGHI
ncbi:hypothetical protein FIBSPDRAFT_1054165 [Athelia psychrophila]|uniref:Uncharacterized protein n=1 Tax=Athelia psychrophila TaxID=1759441 RepID=A0A167VRU4_9AGAM|nr:hypothetical protein FIBSPDRAFT_1054165 [Fibularhizoctonia sp. CBS 109695]